ncbi:hypothetical protein OsJ_04962 [Oryza sativa Japonica Group]|uniref:Uncharacterized protein n=1 Tax=Oryza sativa subsp. japonica TaxID=39947 RepID=B9EX10_ORYSJ|nr:hypothetical protein OsJ_04962 [Oryza sativa Japonica Group]
MKEPYLVDVVEKVVVVAAMKRVDGGAEEVEVDDEGHPVGGGGKGAGGHERPVEAVGAGEEALEGDGGGGRIGLVVPIVEGGGGVILRRRRGVPGESGRDLGVRAEEDFLDVGGGELGFQQDMRS